MSPTWKKVAILPIVAVQLLIPVSGAFPSAQAKGVDPEEKVEYLLTDHLGGIDVVMDEQGNVVERREYLPYGEERISEGDAGERRGFTGKELDGESGLYYYGARYYDPAIGRFTSMDPLVLGEAKMSFGNAIGNPQLLNGYSYALNNPVKYNDPDGKVPQLALAIAIGAAAGATIGMGVQGAYDIYNGQLSDFKSYAASASGGAVEGGLMVIYPGVWMGAFAGALGSATTTITQDILENSKIDKNKTLESAAIGTFLGFIPGPKGKAGSFTSVTKQMNTKLRNGIVENISTKTAGKMVVGGIEDMLPSAAMETTGKVIESTQFSIGQDNLSNNMCLNSHSNNLNTAIKPTEPIEGSKYQPNKKKSDKE
jgi:RHS repeat-associated protein